MRLRWLQLDGYKRFKSSQTIKIDSKLVALVGPNEAGKTSILQSIEHLTHDNIFERGELTRDYEPPGAVLVWAFYLDDEDRNLILDLPDGKSVKWLLVSKYAHTGRKFELRPAVKRNLRPRIKAIRQMSRVVHNPKLAVLEHDDSQYILASLRELIADLENTEAGQTLTTPTLTSISEMSELAATLRDNLPFKVPAYIAGLPEALTKLVEIEREPHPSQIAVDRLRERIPVVAPFSEESRNLLSTYHLQEVHATPPLALGNLADVAGLDLSTLHEAVAHDDQAEVNTQQTRANHRLAEVFAQEWNQSQVKVEFRINGYDLHLQIQDEGGRFSTISERSDGLRQFVALMAFCLQQSIRDPLLLIDEAETHLHYDAQADMVSMLARQAVARQVIYSTHSMGCLPEDLGAGVRLVKPHISDPVSTISNRFWSEKKTRIISTNIRHGRQCARILSFAQRSAC
ncbi:MAG: AAA family ATPase [Gemmatimonadota bacterium]|nr:AAA family ATPase [Gemmatimonadota bacterium]